MNPQPTLRVSLAALGLTLSSCATTPAHQGPVGEEALAGDSPAPMTGPTSPPSPALPTETCDAMVGGGSVRRTAVVQAVDAGLGFWLRGVRVDPQFDQGKRFRGWVVRKFYPDDVCYSRVDIREGDVVTKINGRSVERDWQAHDVFVALRTAPEIVVDYERAGVPRTLRVVIVDR